MTRQSGAAMSVLLIGTLVLATLVGCQGPKTDPRLELIPQKVKFGRTVEVVPGSLSGSGHAQAWQGCMEGRYFYDYRITAGVNAGDAWICCVPVNELLRDSFGCGMSANIASYGTANDRKVQTCLLLDAVSTTLRYIPACIPASLTAPGTGEQPLTPTGPNAPGER